MTAIIKSPDDLMKLEDNFFIGEAPEMTDSSITFKGKGNVLFVEKGVRLRSSKVAFEGNNGLVMLGGNKHPYMLDTTVYNNCSVIFGRDNYFNGVCRIIVSEQCSVIVGNECLISFGIWIRTADPHLVFDSSTHQRVNISRNVLIGDHVWIGQNALILKGTRIGSGSIIGAMSLVAGKTIPSNSSWGGNPAKQIKSGIFWEGSCVHAWTSKKTKRFSKWDGNEFIFEHNNDNNSVSTELSSFPKGKASASERANWYLDGFFEKSEKNRFAIPPLPKRNGLRILNRFLKQ